MEVKMLAASQYRPEELVPVTDHENAATIVRGQAFLTVFRYSFHKKYKFCWMKLEPEAVPFNRLRPKIPAQQYWINQSVNRICITWMRSNFSPEVWADPLQIWDR